MRAAEYPDDSIRVAAVCGSEVTIYGRVADGRRKEGVRRFNNHGQAALFAAEHDEGERIARDRIAALSRRKK